MSENILCDNCMSCFDIEIYDDYYEFQQEETFMVVRCPDCKECMSISWSQSVTFNVSSADKKDLKEFDIEEGNK